MTETLAIIPQGVLDLVESTRADAETLVETRRGTEEWAKLDAADVAIAQMPQHDFTVRHVYTPGLCVREIFMPAGAILTSRIHLFEHPFVISLGVCSVWSDEHGWEVLRAPHTGITKPGTRRALYIHEDTIWSTFHVTTETNPKKMLAAITYDHLKLGHLSEIPADQPKKELS